jgi:2-polyprenyl-3-methyl-5-hydroxy-6-metoxy-1,4-benzoquinol methylase/predicted nuclease with TOPRIM domain
VNRVPESRRALRYRRITAIRPHKAASAPSPGSTPAGASRYDQEIDLASDSTHARVVRLVGTDKHVLELGCSTGYMSRVLRERGCRVVAIEVDAEAARRAKPFCERIVVGDIERLDLAHFLGKTRFDVVVAADFLEHLKDPLVLLRGLKRFIGDSGYVVASLPNVAHGSVRLALLGGRFPSAETGLLDRTHLHFYTHQSMEALYEAAGFAIGRLERQTLPLDASEVPYDATIVSAELLQALSADDDALTYQYITVAYPLPRDVLELIRDRLRHAAAEAASPQTSWKTLAAKRDALQGTAAELQKQNQRLTSANEELSARHSLLEQDFSQLRALVSQQSSQLQEARDFAQREASGELATLRSDLEALRQVTATRDSETSVLSADLAVARTDAVDLRSLLLDAHDQLLCRDDQIAELRARAGQLSDLEPQLRERQASVASLQEELALTKARMLGMQATRVWRIGKCYWWLEAKLKALLGIE